MYTHAVFMLSICTSLIIFVHVITFISCQRTNELHRLASFHKYFYNRRREFLQWPIRCFATSEGININIYTIHKTIIMNTSDKTLSLLWYDSPIMWQYRTGQDSRTGLEDRTEPGDRRGPTGQDSEGTIDRAGKDRAEMDRKPGQDTTWGQDWTGRDGTGRDGTGRDRRSQDVT